MPDQIYEVIAQGARYWFLFLMVLIAWRSYRWLVRDRKQRKKRLKLLPDAGYVGELVVVQGSESLPVGLALPISSEGILGCLRGDDVYVPVKGVAKKHLWYEFDEDHGLRVEPYGRQRMVVDGLTCAGRRARTYLTHGAKLAVGEAVLRLRMFAGFEYAGVNRAAAMDGEAEPEPLTDAAQPTEFATQAPMPSAAITFTPEQLAAFQQMQQMQWMDAWQRLQAAQSQPQNAANALPDANAQLAAPAVLATEKGEFLAPPRTAAGGAILSPADADAPEPADDAASAQPQPDERAAMAHTRRRARVNPLPPIAAPGEQETENTQADWADADMPTADEYWQHTRAGVRDASLRRVPDETAAHGEGDNSFGVDATFAPRVTFYPPVLEQDAAFTPDAAEPATGVPEETWPYAAYPQSEARFADGGYTYPEYIEPETADEPYEYADEDEAPRSLYVEPDEAAQAKRMLWDKYLKGGRRR